VLRRAPAAHVGKAALGSLVAALFDREAAFETMRRLHRGKVEFDTPESFAFGEAWFESLWPLSSSNRLRSRRSWAMIRALPASRIGSSAPALARSDAPASRPRRALWKELCGTELWPAPRQRH